MGTRLRVPGPQHKGGRGAAEPPRTGRRAVVRRAVPGLSLRPLAAWSCLAGAKASCGEKALVGWFGIRDVGSVYYLAYAFGYGAPGEFAQRLAALVLSLVAVSIVAHGISITPLMKRYEGSRDA